MLPHFSTNGGELPGGLSIERSKLNKFEHVLGFGYLMSVAVGPNRRASALYSRKLSLWADRHGWKHYLDHFVGAQ